MASNIPYTDEGWNPVSGCTPCSPGCANCYAKATAERFPNAHAGFGAKVAGFAKAVSFSQVVLHPDRLSKPLHWRRPRVVLVPTMGDLFHPDVPDAFLVDVLQAISSAHSRHTWLLLTKRAERMQEFMSRYMAMDRLGCFPNVWLGVTVCNQEEADAKIPILLDAPAAHRWISVEPMLGPIAMGRFFVNPKRRIDQVIVGCESGPKRRPMRHEWANAIEAQCERAGVPYYLKQRSLVSDGTGKVLHFDPKPGDLAWRE